MHVVRRTAAWTLGAILTALPAWLLLNLVVAARFPSGPEGHMSGIGVVFAFGIVVVGLAVSLPSAAWLAWRPGRRRILAGVLCIAAAGVSGVLGGMLTTAPWVASGGVGAESVAVALGGGVLVGVAAADLVLGVVALRGGPASSREMRAA